ncbi:type I secretion system permease/ATPase [Pseudomonas sp. N040]|uniref:type I secretion system permease/ATPase n=1 Tax=Pseudomonas sp. N040 TaxID=2785325 RepID=UPI0018A302EB|nr:type I secretion system permease/ATPase [Pseudomonas sp. N040]MBF7731666.1 type I secretion system permease/ATPase [Pseudomonas sp. N040]MBW7015310.1 type I secretion system permease/ATPase [Pseudomonas sp. N040]
MTSPAAASELRHATLALRRFFVRALLFSVCINLLALTPTLYMLEVYGRVIFSRNATTLLMLTLLAIALYALMELIDWVRQRLLQLASTSLDEFLAERVFNTAFEARLRNLPVGMAPLSDLRSLRGFIASPASTALMDAPISLLFMLIIFILSVPLGVLVLVAALAMLAIGYFTERKTRVPLSEAQRLAMEAQRYAATTLKNAQVMTAMGMTGNIQRRWQERQQQFLGKQAEASEYAGVGSAATRFILVTISSAVLGLACWLTLVGELDAHGSSMIVAWILAARTLAPLQQLIGQWLSVLAARAAYSRLDNLLANLPEREAGMPLPPPSGALSVEALVVAAPGSQTTILRGLNFKLEPGQTLAVIGPSASGKSTLARALVGLWPAASGAVRLDGSDVERWNKEELGPHIGYLPQDNELFDGTLGENIARFGDSDPDKLQASSELVGLGELLESLPDGFASLIGAAGGVLSGGQRQRVALARALYGDPHFVVLDEPNSSLDEAGDRALLQTLLQLKARKVTVVIITQRINVLPAVDCILLLQDGKQQLFGPRDEVLAALAGKPPAKLAPPAMPLAPGG